MIKNCTAFISCFVSLTGFGSTSYLYSLGFAPIPHAVERFCITVQWRWIKEQQLGKIKSPWFGCFCIVRKDFTARTRKQRWSLVHMYGKSIRSLISLETETAEIPGSFFSWPGSLSGHGVRIWDGPEHCGASTNLRMIIPFECNIHKHISPRESCSLDWTVSQKVSWRRLLDSDGRTT